MRSLRRGTLWSAGRRWLWAGSFGLTVSGVALAGDTPAGRNAAGLRAEYDQLIGVSHEACGEDACAEEGCGEEACGEEGCADEGCRGGYLFGPDEPWTLQGALCGDDPCDPPPVVIGGWTQFGYHNRSDGLFNSHPDQLVSHQNWLYAEKVADGSEGLGFGGRADFLYGADAQDTQAYGEPFPQDHWDNDWDHGIYGSALPQLFGEVAMGDLSVKVGKFYTPIGYEVVAAPDGFFYSHSFTHIWNEPFTHTGVLGQYAATDTVTLYGGWVAGWDTGYDRFADLDSSKGSSAIGGASVGVTDITTVTWIFLAGDMGVRGEGYNQSVVIDNQLTEKLNYIIESDLVEFNNPTFGPNHSLSAVNYLIYSISDTLGVGGRAEWWKANGSSVYQTTAGLNVKPAANLTIRPEIRYQWGNEGLIAGSQGAFSDAGPTGKPGVDEQAIFGVDAILTF